MISSEPNMIDVDDNEYRPECLTISLGSKCNLNCLYCFSDKNKFEDHNRLAKPDFEKCIQTAAEMVAQNCQSKGIPFFLGFQGGGEPLSYFDQLKHVYNLISKFADKNNLQLFSFITSNGCMDEQKYEWISERFNRVCISLDGNIELNDFHRKDENNNGTYEKIISSIDVLKKNNKIPSIRTTITKYNVNEMVDIVRHVILDLELTEIQIEPVFFIHKDDNLQPAAEIFVRKYIEARKFAERCGCTVTYSGYRKNAFHGTYCNLQKKVLFIGPNGHSSICLFKENESASSPYIIGYYHRETGTFQLDKHKIEQLMNLTSRYYRQCWNCEIRNTCVRGCPDLCLVENDDNAPVRESLRCRINRLLYKKHM